MVWLSQQRPWADYDDYQGATPICAEQGWGADGTDTGSAYGQWISAGDGGQWVRTDDTAFVQSVQLLNKKRIVQNMENIN